MAEEATTREGKKLSFVDCERLLGHCWMMGLSQGFGDGSRLEWCQHCPATRTRGLTDWAVTPPAEPQDGS